MLNNVNEEPCLTGKLSIGVSSSISPKNSLQYWAILACCRGLQWFSNDRTTGHSEVLKADSAMLSITSCKTRLTISRISKKIYPMYQSMKSENHKIPAKIPKNLTLWQGGCQVWHWPWHWFPAPACSRGQWLAPLTGRSRSPVRRSGTRRVDTACTSPLRICLWIGGLGKKTDSARISNEIKSQPVHVTYNYTDEYYHFPGKNMFLCSREKQEWMKVSGKLCRNPPLIQNGIEV